MTINKASVCLGALLILAPSLCNAQHAVPPTPTFTISATNVTMPSSGTVSIPFVLTSVNGFAGQLIVSCTPPTESASVRLPYIDLGGPVFAFTLTANGTAPGSISLQAKKPPVVYVPARMNLPVRPGHHRRATWSLASVFLLGIGLRKRKAWAARLSLAICMLIALTGLNACGGGPTLTPGTYTYTLTASQNSPSLNLPQPSSSTTVTVTVPAGIPTNN